MRRNRKPHSASDLIASLENAIQRDQLLSKEEKEQLLTPFKKQRIELICLAVSLIENGPGIDLQRFLRESGLYIPSKTIIASGEKGEVDLFISRGKVKKSPSRRKQKMGK